MKSAGPVIAGALSWTGVGIAIGAAVTAIGHSIRVNPTTGEMGMGTSDQMAINTVFSMLSGAGPTAGLGTRLATSLATSVAQSSFQYDSSGDLTGFSVPQGRDGSAMLLRTGFNMAASGINTEMGFNSGGNTLGSAMLNALPAVAVNQAGNVFGEYAVRQMVGRQYSNYEAVTTPSTAILGRILGQGLGTWAGNELRQSESISQYLANEELERVARQAQKNGNKHAAAGIFQALGVRRDEESWWIQGLDAVGDGLGAGISVLNSVVSGVGQYFANIGRAMGLIFKHGPFGDIRTEEEKWAHTVALFRKHAMLGIEPPDVQAWSNDAVVKRLIRAKRVSERKEAIKQYLLENQDIGSEGKAEHYARLMAELEGMQLEHQEHLEQAQAYLNSGDRAAARDSWWKAEKLRVTIANNAQTLEAAGISLNLPEIGFHPAVPQGPALSTMEQRSARDRAAARALERETQEIFDRWTTKPPPSRSHGFSFGNLWTRFEGFLSDTFSSSSDEVSRGHRIRQAAIHSLKLNREAYEKGFQSPSGWTVVPKSQDPYREYTGGPTYQSTYYIQDPTDKNYYKIIRDLPYNNVFFLRSKEKISAAEYNRQSGFYTNCNVAASLIAMSYGAPNLFYHKGIQYKTGPMVENLRAGLYNTKTHEYRKVDFKTAERWASEGNFAFVINPAHIAVLTGGYSGEEDFRNLKTFQAGLYFGGADVDSTVRKAWGSNPENLEYYIWTRKNEE